MAQATGVGWYQGPRGGHVSTAVSNAHRYAAESDGKRGAAETAKAARKLEHDASYTARTTESSSARDARHAAADAAMRKAAAKAAAKIDHIATSKQELMNKAALCMTRIATRQTTAPEGALKGAIGASERAVVFGSPKALDFLISNAPHGKSQGYKLHEAASVPLPEESTYVYGTPSVEINWQSAKDRYNQLMSGTKSVGDLLAENSSYRHDRVAIWVYCMQFKFSETHKLSKSEDDKCEKSYIRAIETGSFPADFFSGKFSSSGGKSGGCIIC